MKKDDILPFVKGFLSDEEARMVRTAIGFWIIRNRTLDLQDEKLNLIVLLFIEWLIADNKLPNFVN